ncbi:hypothetical protein L1887_30746 [Cichorium endivia]|nr:hypothetical protein L1887_30746 [Cichorium endivia]
MQKGDDKQPQQHSQTSAEISQSSATTFWLTGTPYTSIVSDGGPTYRDIIRILSQVELPPPSPVQATSVTLPRENLINFEEGHLINFEEGHLINFEEGQPSGTKKDDEGQPSGTKKDDEIQGNLERERELKAKHENNREPETQTVPDPETYRTLRNDQAAILDDAINYIKSLQMQMQMMEYCMRLGAMQQGLYMSPPTNPSIQAPYFSPYFQMMRPMTGVGYNTAGQFTYFPSSLPLCPPFFTGFNPSLPQMGVGMPSLPRMFPIPQLQFPSQPAQYSPPLLLDSIPPPTVPQVGSGMASQFSYHTRVTSQVIDMRKLARCYKEAQQVSTTSVQATPSNILRTSAQMHDTQRNHEKKP